MANDEWRISLTLTLWVRPFATLALWVRHSPIRIIVQRVGKPKPPDGEVK